MKDYTHVLLLSLIVLAMGDRSALHGQQPLLSIQRAVNLCWSSKSNHLYSVQSQSDTTGTNWTIAIPSIRASTTNTCAAEVATPARGFYEVREFPPPANMIWIEPGTFTMGSPDHEPERSPDEGPQTLVRITRGYWMGKYEVTQADYMSVIGSNPSRYTGESLRPVEQVSWFDCTNYCHQLTIREQNAGRIPRDYIYRLPTEAEWEYAFRAGTTTPFHFGTNPDNSDLTLYAWYGYNECCNPHPGGEKLPNAWGLYDMTGNVWEYVNDWYVDSLPGDSVIDPTGPDTGTLRTFRGGAWSRFPWECRSAYRNRTLPTNASSNTGFRVVLGPR